MNENPLVSVLLLSMNHEPFIENCINSLKNQTYKNIEIIYLDNASADNTFEKGKKLLEQSGLPYQVYFNKESKGISKNLNFLLEKSSGTYYFALSTDDWLTPDSTEEKLKYFIKYPEFGMVYSSCYYYYYGIDKMAVTELKHYYKEGWILKDLLKRNFISTVAVMIKKSTIEAVGNYDEDSLLEDWDMWIRIAEKFPIGYLDRELAYYGIKKGCNITGNPEFMIKGYEYIVNKYAHYPENKEAKKLLTAEKIYYYANNKPSVNTLIFILKNYRFNYLYTKQIGKTIIGILKKSFTKQSVNI